MLLGPETVLDQERRIGPVTFFCSDLRKFAIGPGLVLDRTGLVRIGLGSSKPSFEGLKFVSGVSAVIENHRKEGLDDSEPSTRTIQKQVLKAWNCVLVRQWNQKWLVHICI